MPIIVSFSRTPRGGGQSLRLCTGHWASCFIMQHQHNPHLGPLWGSGSQAARVPAPAAACRPDLLLLPFTASFPRTGSGVSKQTRPSREGVLVSPHPPLHWEVPFHPERALDYHQGLWGVKYLVLPREKISQDAILSSSYYEPLLS